MYLKSSDLSFAERAFKKYVSTYDTSNMRIRLKIIHTYKVVKIAKELAESVFGKENIHEITLAQIIALLHDVGRFEQLKRFDSFDDYSTIDHAELACELLFEKENLIKHFCPDINSDLKEIIRFSIKNHNKFAVECREYTNLSKTTLLHAHLIRDADKLDIFRVVLEEDIWTLEGCFEWQLAASKISDRVFIDAISQKTILGSNRKTFMDRWVSHLVLVYDLHFRQSIVYVNKNNIVNNIINRICYLQPETIQRMMVIKKHIICYINHILSLESPIVTK